MHLTILEINELLKKSTTELPLDESSRSGGALEQLNAELTTEPLNALIPIDRRGSSPSTLEDTTNRRSSPMLIQENTADRHSPLALTDESVQITAVESRVKLPKFSLKKFNGDITKWSTFWDTFESSIHQNLSLSSIDKFHYLNSLLESSAAAVSGLSLTAANYEEAISILTKRFGNKQLIINRHMDNLLSTNQRPKRTWHFI